MIGKSPHSFKVSNPTPLNAPPNNVIFRRKTPSINVNASMNNNQHLRMSNFLGGTNSGMTSTKNGGRGASTKNNKGNRAF